MKFKKVEISAFRIYNDPLNATFDFTTKTGEIANFISLYAPNGFGKTSFYDAVEWGITKSINRFHIRGKELEKLAKYQTLVNSENELALIRNSGTTRETYVKIYNDSTSKPIESKFKIHGNQSHEVNFKKPVIHDFQKVILSQEWVAAFLMESNGEERYKKFIDNPELKEIDNYYNNLKLQYSIYIQNKKDLEEAIGKEKRELKQLEEENLLEKFNSQIKLIIENFGDSELTSISLDTTQNEITRLRGYISTKIISTDNLDKLNNFLENLSSARNGDEKIIGIDNFFEIIQLIEDTRRTLEIAKANIQKFEIIENLKNTLSSYQKDNIEFLNKQSEIKTILVSFEEFIRVEARISNKIESINTIRNLLKELEEELGKTNRNIISSEEELRGINHRISNIENRLQSLPTLQNNLLQTEKHIKEINQSLEDRAIKLVNFEKEIRHNDDILNEFIRVKEEAKNGQYSRSIVNEDKSLLALINKVEEKSKILRGIQKKLSEIDLKIKQQDSLNLQIEAFIKEGLNIVNQSRTSSCPLCENTYSSFNQLAERIVNNRALSNILQQLLTEKNDLDKQNNDLLIDINNENQVLYNQYDKQIENLKAVNISKLEEIRILNQSNNSNKEELARLTERMDEYLNQIEGLSIGELKNKLNENLDKEKNDKKSLNRVFLQQQDAKNEILQKIGNNLKEISLLEEEISTLRRNELYINISGWLKENYPNEMISENRLVELIKDVTKKINEGLVQILQIERDIRKTEKDVIGFTLEGLMSQEKTLESRVYEYKTKSDTYTDFLNKSGVKFEGENKSDLLEIIDKNQVQAKLELESEEKRIKEYRNLERYGEHIYEFLQSEIIKNKIKIKEEELEFLNGEIEPLISNERQKVKEYLEKKIKKFFSEDLIQSLYKKIDPHPDFKEVQFKANFDSDSPRLDVFVKSKNKVETLIPNLYFSTAQINILSLCIFLASALSSKKYNCIFIDDPIQSMDSINVLSTIDLLRSISVNYDKQIILSTHDENFHNLLKKKMPPELFKSKFLELESFGKVKRDLY